MPVSPQLTAGGKLCERLALEHYERLGCVLLERNYRTSIGEIDLDSFRQNVPSSTNCEVETIKPDVPGNGGRLLHICKVSQTVLALRRPDSARA